VQPRNSAGVQLQAARVLPFLRRAPVRQWVLSLPIPLRVLLAAQPELVTPVLQVVQRVIARHLPDAAWAQPPTSTYIFTACCATGCTGVVPMARRDVLVADMGQPCLAEPDAAGQGELERKTPWRDGRAHLVTSAKLRALVVPQGPEVGGPATEAEVAGECEAGTVQHPGRTHRVSWARRLKRVFDIDTRHGPNCGAGDRSNRTRRRRKRQIHAARRLFRDPTRRTLRACLLRTDS